ncbi:hypothetical protein [Lysobacter sp. GCM10012299]|uniref:hypothetical protein n=1 Tax=Lysobacter sp. GCM10012299 TaxID=3317333 RepID=UPI00361196FB
MAAEQGSRFVMGTRYQVVHAPFQAVCSSRITYDDGALRIAGCDRHDSVIAEVRFEDPLSVSISEEGTRLRSLQALGGIVGSIVKDTASELLAWLDAEALGTRDMANAQHFIVRIGEEIVDVICFTDPVVMLEVRCDS